MIRPGTPPDAVAVGRHYDELDPFYRQLWGEDLHHGLWRRGDETPEEAVRALTRLVAERAGLRQGDRVCDVGCGYGGTARYLAHRLGCEVVGVTLSAAQHRYATQWSGEEESTDAGGRPSSGGPTPRFLLADWLDAPVEPAGFDAVLAIECFSHLSDKPAGILKAREALRPGGRLVAALWMAGPDPSPWRRRHLLEPICERGRLPGLATESEYRAWVEAAGFEITGLEDLSTRVRRTWRVCMLRMGALLARSWEARRYLRGSANAERGFALALPRMWLAYRVGALRYGLLSARAP